MYATEKKRKEEIERKLDINKKAVNTANEVACGWAGAVIKKANQAFEQER